MGNCLTILSRIPKLMRNRLANILSKLLAESHIYIGSILSIAIWNRRIYWLTGRTVWKLLILDWVTHIRKIKCSRQPVDHLAMQLLKWLPVRSTMGWRWISGVAELSYLPWCVDIYLFRIAILRNSTRKFFLESTFFLDSFRTILKIC